MAELAVKTRRLDMHLEQVQDFTPTPMTLATEIYYTGIHPYTGEKVFTAHSKDEKLNQRKYFFWYDAQYHRAIIDSLRQMGRRDLIEQLFPAGTPRYNGAPKPPAKQQGQPNRNYKKRK
jgi:radical SAM superfamily enzyme YgiQ (UPF0313 family)